LYRRFLYLHAYMYDHHVAVDTCDLPCADGQTVRPRKAIKTCYWFL
jgi:hypothetical protein